MNSADKLIREIKSLIDPRGNWKISRDRVLDLLGMKIQDAYPLMAASRDPLVDFSTSEYGRENTGVLISLMECLGFKNAPEDFWRAGLWIPYEVQVELQESLIRKISSAIGTHEIDYDTFLAMFDVFPRFLRAANCYLEEFFSEEALIDEAVKALLNEHPETEFEFAEVSLKLLAAELLRREIISYRVFFTGLFSELKSRLIVEGRIESEYYGSEYDGRGAGAPEPGLHKDLREAGRIFGYTSNQAVEKRELRQRYKNLMKRYHPDINPGGLETAKKINRAYGVFLKSC